MEVGERVEARWRRVSTQTLYASGGSIAVSRRKRGAARAWGEVRKKRRPAWIVVWVMRETSVGNLSVGYGPAVGSTGQKERGQLHCFTTEP